MTSRLRQLPSVEKVLQSLEAEVTHLPRPALTAVIRRTLAGFRSSGQVPAAAEIQSAIRSSVRALAAQRIRPVINAAGAILHTNLGRAPLAAEALAEIQSANLGYNSLELDLTTGERGFRGAYVEHNLALLCGAEAALVVNNCAAALLLILHHLVTASRPEVVISRGELVQIGGGFRIPEILEAAGARLREVGTTNRTTLPDYAKALSTRTALILKVHRSNFVMDGFVEAVGTRELAALARKRRVPLVEDLGSGAILDTAQFAGLEHEPTPAETLRKGADLVCFSGDKLLGGPQAGLIAGRARRVGALRRDPFFRALRCDKLVLTALQATVDLYLGRLGSGAPPTLPLAEMLSTSVETLMRRAEQICAAVGVRGLKLEPRRSSCQIGGGTLPRSALESVALQVSIANLTPAQISARFRSGAPPVVGYIAKNRFFLELRTVLPSQDPELIDAIRRAGAAPSSNQQL